MANIAVALLDAKADPLAVDDEGRTPLHLLCMLQEEFDEASRDVLAALTRHCPAAIFSVFLLHKSTRSTLLLLALSWPRMVRTWLTTVPSVGNPVKWG